MEAQRQISERFSRVDIIDELVSRIAEDVKNNPQKYSEGFIFLVGVDSPVDNCHTSLIARLRNINPSLEVRSIREVNGNTGGVYFNVDEYVAQGLTRLAEKQVEGGNRNPYFIGSGITPGMPIKDYRACDRRYLAS